MEECYFSVDVETAGPWPVEYSMLEIGICNVTRPEETFHSYIKPVSYLFDVEAIEKTGLTLEYAKEHGRDPKILFPELHEWIFKAANGSRPVMVGLNSGFDFSFFNYYMRTYAGSNPFGFASIDIKAYYMGLNKSTWDQTRSSQIDKVLNPILKPDHTALGDALYQAELFRLMRGIPLQLKTPQAPKL